MKTRVYISVTGIEGAVMVLSPLPLLLPSLGTDPSPALWQVIIALLASITCFSCAFTLLRIPLLGTLLGAIAATGSYVSVLPYITANPFAALTGSVVLISIVFALVDVRGNVHIRRTIDHVDQSLQRAWGAALAVLFLVVLVAILGMSESALTPYVISASSIIAQILFLHWSVTAKSTFHLLLPVAGLSSICLSFIFSSANNIPNISLLMSLCCLMSFPRDKEILEKEPWWEMHLNHPARMLFTTFLVLCILGTCFLALPVSTRNGTIDPVDAAFTSVSAVCVTGLIVLDTPNDFTLFGQFSILLLIQLGGLGIMTITTVALHTMGRRLSLKQERLLTSMTDTDHKDLVHSLTTILKFTIVAEGIGTLLLTILFYSTGDPFAQALWRGVFTAISAFCNAGFSLQSDSLIRYQTNPFMLHIVSILIIFGGMAPATSLIVPKWLTGKPVPIPARIALVTTATLLFTGAFFIMVFELDGVLAGLSFGDKIHNAWFQSVTLRTAGFNSVDITNVASPTFMIMIIYMFIGGSPGGTAGGVKTATIGILAMTFWANITNRNEVIIQNRRIHSATINRAFAIVFSGMVVWLLVVLMLEVTQQVSARDLIFEATSAIGTVGLSTGATSLFDEVGKIVIIIAMFVGRIGPMTIFMLLSNEQSTSASRSPEAKISLT